MKIPNAYVSVTCAFNWCTLARYFFGVWLVECREIWAIHLNCWCTNVRYSAGAHHSECPYVLSSANFPRLQHRAALGMLWESKLEQLCFSSAFGSYGGLNRGFRKCLTFQAITIHLPKCDTHQPMTLPSWRRLLIAPFRTRKERHKERQ